jgi:lysozyme
MNWQKIREFNELRMFFFNAPAIIPGLDGIDISGHQSDLDLRIVPADFVIIKATQGVQYVSPVCDRQYQQAKRLGMKLGVYHFANGLDPVAEAQHFVRSIRGYLGEAILALDWEADAVNRGREWVRAFVRSVKQSTGVTPLIYGTANSFDYNEIPGLAREEGCKLWVAHYLGSGRERVLGFH